MGVRVVCQAEVPCVLRGVQGLHHGTQQHGVHLHSVGTVVRRLGNRLKLRHLRLIADGCRNGQRFEIGTQNLYLIWRWVVVHTKQRHLVVMQNEIGCTDIGHQHALFNESVRLRAYTRHDFLDAPRFIADDLCLHRIEIYGTTHFARAQQSGVHPMQMKQMRYQLSALGSLRAPGITQDGSHFGVREPCLTVHHGRIKLVRVQLPIFSDQHVADHAQTIDMRIQRTQTIAELFRQHGNHPAGKIHTGRSVVSVHIDRIAVLYVMADIGNRYQQTPAFVGTNFCRLTVHGIVKIACILPVDGNQRHIAQIHTIFAIFGQHLVGQSLCSG